MIVWGLGIDFDILIVEKVTFKLKLRFFFRIIACVMIMNKYVEENVF